MAISKLEEAQLDILDLLIEAGGAWFGPDGEVLLSMAQAIFQDEGITTLDNRYKRVSMAVLRLEAIELVSVSRRYRDEAEKANIVESVHLT